MSPLLTADSRHCAHRTLHSFLADERAAALVDYAILMACFSVLMMASLKALSTQAGNNIARTETGLTNMAAHP